MAVSSVGRAIDGGGAGFAAGAAIAFDEAPAGLGGIGGSIRNSTAYQSASNSCYFGLLYRLCRLPRERAGRMIVLIGNELEGNVLARECLCVGGCFSGIIEGAISSDGVFVIVGPRYSRSSLRMHAG